MFRTISAAFTAGISGGLINSLTVWLLGRFDVTSLLGVALRPELTPPWLYQRLVWGGLWGLLFLLPLWEKNLPLRATVFSLAPSVYALFVVFPAQGKGVYGIALGTLTPLLVIALNLLWGIVAAHWFRAACR